MMKNYIQRLTKACHPAAFILWWLLRIAVLYALISNIAGNSTDVSAVIQYAFTFVAMFIWEICMAMPEKSFMRLMPASLQVFSTLLLFSAAFLEALLF